MTEQHVTIKTGPHSTAQGEVIADEWVTLWGIYMHDGCGYLALGGEIAQ